MKKLLVQIDFDLDIELKELTTKIVIEADKKEALIYRETVPIKKEDGPSFDSYIENYKTIVEATLSKLDIENQLGK